LKKQFLTFLLTSGIAAAVNIISRAGFSTFLNYDVAIVLAYLIGMGTAYILAKIFVFDPSGKAVHREMTGFVIVSPHHWRRQSRLYQLFRAQIYFLWKGKMSLLSSPKIPNPQSISQYYG